VNTLEFYQQTYTYDIGNNLTALFNHSAGSIALVIINIVFYDVGFVGFSELVKGVETKPKCNKNATATRVKKETTVVVCATTVPDT
jgi:hypothetical protein